MIQYKTIAAMLGLERGSKRRTHLTVKRRLNGRPRKITAKKTRNLRLMSKSGATGNGRRG